MDETFSYKGVDYKINNFYESKPTSGQDRLHVTTDPDIGLALINELKIEITKDTTTTTYEEGGFEENSGTSGQYEQDDDGLDLAANDWVTVTISSKAIDPHPLDPPTNLGYFRDNGCCGYWGEDWLIISWDPITDAPYYEIRYRAGWGARRTAWSAWEVAAEVDRFGGYGLYGLFPAFSGIFYEVEVRGVGSNGWGGQAARLPARTDYDAPTPVSDVELTTGDTELTVSWTAGHRNDRWKVQYGTGGTSNEYWVDEPSTTITGLQNATEYQIGIQGWRDLGGDPFGTYRWAPTPIQYAYTMLLVDAPENVEVVDTVVDEPDLNYRPGFPLLPPVLPNLPIGPILPPVRAGTTVMIRWDAAEGAPTI